MDAHQEVGILHLARILQALVRILFALTNDDDDDGGPDTLHAIKPRGGEREVR